MNVLIIEDEELSVRQLTQYLAAHEPAATVVGVLKSISKALAWFAQNPMPDLIFSDIELLDGNAFAIYEQVPIGCPIVFITAYDQFLLQAFQGQGIAYLLKPFTAAQFAGTLTKYHALRRSFAPAGAGLSAEVLASLSQALRQPRLYKQRFTVRLRGSLHLLAVDEVAYLQAEEGLVFAIDQRGTRYALTGTLTELEQQLDPARFFRLNRSEIVHISYIDKAEPYGKDRLAIKLKTSPDFLLTSATHTAGFRKWLDA
ncbi:MAG: response regulator transcription factor [Hymenobacter sp.]|nr:MAG: response regulator transcription factor [Hymenobacter sp.]